MVIEKGYYSNGEIALKLIPICVHCGEEGSNSFVLGLPQLQERCMTGGYNCFPMCILCIDNGKKAVHTGRKNELQARNEQIARVTRSN